MEDEDLMMMQEKELAIGRLLDQGHCNCEGIWRRLPEHLQRDKEVVLAAVRTAKELPPKTIFERHFPQSLRFDRDVVLALSERTDFAEIYKTRHLFVPDCLANDKEVMIAYCNKIPRALQECSEDLCDDLDVVKAAISRDGLELQYASLRLQETEEVVKLACAKDGKALEYCPPGSVRDKLTSDRKFMKHVLKVEGGSMFRLVPQHLKQDRELLLTALGHGGMSFRFCPYNYQTCRSFLLEALALNGGLFLELTKTQQLQKELAEAAVVSPKSNKAVHELALEAHPSLIDFKPVVMAIVGSSDETFLEELFPQHRQFCDDKSVMLTTIKRFPNLVRFCSPRLITDPDILSASITSETAANVLKTIPLDFQLEHSYLVQKAIEVADARYLRKIQVHVSNDLWSKKSIAVAWIKRGGNVFGTHFQQFLGDRDMALAIAEFSPMSFSRVSAVLRYDRDFMISAVNVNGCVLRYASADLRGDIDMRIRAGASKATYLQTLSAAERLRLKTFLGEKLELFDCFVAQFLRGIAIARPNMPPAQRSSLTLLDRGVETSQAFKQLIADFLGVPTGEMLHMMRKALKNLENPTVNASDSSNDETHRFQRDRIRMAYRRRAGDERPLRPRGGINQRLAHGQMDDDPMDDIPGLPNFGAMVALPQPPVPPNRLNRRMRLLDQERAAFHEDIAGFLGQRRGGGQNAGPVLQPPGVHALLDPSVRITDRVEDDEENGRIEFDLSDDDEDEALIQMLLM